MLQVGTMVTVRMRPIEGARGVVASAGARYTVRLEDGSTWSQIYEHELEPVNGLAPQAVDVDLIDLLLSFDPTYNQSDDLSVLLRAADTRRDIARQLSGMPDEFIPEFLAHFGFVNERKYV